MYHTWMVWNGMGIDALNCFCSPLPFLWTFKKRKNEQCSWMTHEYAVFHLLKYSSPIISRSCPVWTFSSNKLLYPQSMSLHYTKMFNHFTSQKPFFHQRILSNKSWIDPSEKKYDFIVQPSQSNAGQWGGLKSLSLTYIVTTRCILSNNTSPSETGSFKLLSLAIKILASNNQITW